MPVDEVRAYLDERPVVGRGRGTDAFKEQDIEFFVSAAIGGVVFVVGQRFTLSL